MNKKLSLLLILVLSMGLLSSCGKKEPAGSFTPGVYEGVGQGKGGDVKVQVEVSADKIEKIDVLDHSETPGITDPAFEQIPKEVLEKQTVQVDTVSGCTYASQGLIDAITDAVEKAK